MRRKKGKKKKEKKKRRRRGLAIFPRISEKKGLDLISSLSNPPHSYRLKKKGGKRGRGEKKRKEKIIAYRNSPFLFSQYEKEKDSEWL